MKLARSDRAPAFPVLAGSAFLGLLLGGSGLPLESACVAAVPAPAGTDRWRVGAAVPPLDSLVWIRPDGPRDLFPGEVTVLTFWAPWDAAGFRALAHQDSLAAIEAGRVHVVGVSVAPPGWTRRALSDPQASWKNLDVACDPHARYFERAHDHGAKIQLFDLPYTVLLRQDRTVLWWGSPVARASAPSEFDSILVARLGCAYSVEDAVARFAALEKAGDDLHRLEEAVAEREPARVESLLAVLSSSPIPARLARTAVNVLNETAWELATREGKTAREIDLALRAADLGWRYGGSTDAPFIDTRARVLFEAGRVAEAVELEKQAVLITGSGPDSKSFGKALARYRAASTGAPDAPATTPQGRPLWSGAINDAFQAVAGKDYVLVLPANITAHEDSIWRTELGWIAQKTGCVFRTADQVTADERSSRLLILHGTPRDNPLTRAVLDTFAIGVDSTGVVFGGDRVRVNDPFLITAVPNPWSPSIPVLVYAAARARFAHGLNRVMHGPTQLVVGWSRAGGHRVITADDYGAVPAPGSGAAVFHVPAEALPPLQAAWAGTLNEALTGFDRASDVYLVPPDSCGSAADESAWAAEMSALQRRFGGITKRVPELPEPSRYGKVLTLYGTSATNRLTREVMNAYGISLEALGVRFGDRFFPASQPVLIAALPSPWDPNFPVVIYTSAASGDGHNLNRLFHGPTGAVVGRRNGDQLEEVVAFDLRADGRKPVPDLPPPSLTRAEAEEDFDSLASMLDRDYAGLRDLDQRLRESGSSFAERTQAHRAEIGGRKSISWSEFEDLLRRYLEPVEDTHFFMSGTGPKSDGGFLQVRAKFIRQLRPYFSDLRLAGDSAGAVVVRAPAELARLAGGASIQVPRVPDPHDAVPGRPYLFPTLPDPGASRPKGKSEFLLGVLGYDEDPPEAIAVSFASKGGGETTSTELPVHRGQMKDSALYKGSSAAGIADGVGIGTWGVTFPTGGPPWLAVRTMDPSRLSGYSASADTLRALDRFVLDLRGNSGGNDQPGLDWVRRLSRQRLRAMGSGSGRLRGGTGSATAFWLVPPADGPARRPYTGRVAVLVDKGVASSGETMTLLAGQLPGAVLIGENTAGCARYGNVAEHPPLPHSRLRFRYGVTWFVMDAIRSNPEGVGLFPDYWLDQADPEPAVKAWLAGSTR